jgi:hypothetical protein
VRGLLHSMPQMFGNLSIRPKMAVGLLAVPVAAAALLGGDHGTAGWGERAEAGGLGVPA